MKNRRILYALILLLCIITLSIVSSAAETFAPGSSAAYFVDNAKGKDTNAGTSASAPLKTLGKANAYLRELGGGTIVICGEVAISSSFSPADIGGAVTYTSVWNNVDYRTTNGAKLVISANLAFNNDTYFKNINLSITASTLIFSGRCNNFGFGSGVSVTNDSGLSSFTYPTIIGGWNNPGTLAGSSNSNDYSVHVYSGTWNSVSAGHRRSSSSNPVSSLNGDIALVITGGTFKDNVYGTGMNIHTGRFFMNISGGTFDSAVAPIKRLGTIASTAECSANEFTADILVRISGGTFGGRFRLAESPVSTTALTYPPKGNATVVVTGGTFNSDFVGYGVIGSVLLKYKESVLSTDKIKGFPVFKTGSQSMSSAATEEARFTNPIGDKSDPYVIEKDGIYYYCFSSSETVDGTAYAAVKIAAHGSVPFGELTTQMRSVFNASETTIANAKHEYWAPELHYFDAATVGSANAGWYIYVAADDGDNYNHRMYVLRATDPENPLSDYKMVGKITDSTNKWAIDGTVLQHGGKIYFVWSGWEGDTNVAQNIYIAEMSNPWTISSSRVLLSKPTYSWETQGSPDVNEGPQVLKAPDGTVHIVYSASGSWDQYYCYGVLTLTGSNPLNASHWYKATSSKFSSGNGMYAPGHGTFVQDAVGDWWMIYHANDSLVSSSEWWAARSVYTKKFSFTKMTLNGVSVSYPSFGTPAGATSTQYIDVPTADYHASGDHFYSPLMKTTSGTAASLTKTCYICKQTATICKVDVPTATAAVNANGGIKITVTPTVSGATGYIIYRSTSESGSYSQIAVSKSATYTDTTAKIGTTYYYKVKQYVANAYGNDATYGRLVSSASAATAGVTAVPPAISISLYYDGEIVNVSWAASETAEKYRIFRRVAGTSDWEDTVRMTATNSYVDSAVSPDTTYEYAVQDWTLVGDKYYYSQVAPSIKEITTTLYDAPSLTVANTDEGIKLTSTAVSDASAYKFYRSTDGVNFTQLTKTESKSFVDETAVAGTTYYYRTRAYTTSGGVTVYSPVSENVAVIRLETVTPTITYDGNEVKLTWSAPSVATKYRIFKRVAGTSDWGETLRIAESTSYSDTDVTSGTTYEYAVQTWARLGDAYVYGPLKLCTITVTALDTPTLTVKNTESGISLTSTAVSGAEGYKFYRSTDGVNFTQIAKTTETTYEDTTAVAGTTYYYRTRAYSSEGGAIYSPLSETKAIVKLSPITVSLYYDGEIVKLSWKASATAEKYRVFKRIAGTSDWGDALIMTTGRTYIDTDIAANTTYEYAVQDWTLVDGSYCYSALKLFTITTSQPEAPVLGVTSSNEGYVLTITEVEDASGYKFYRSTDGENFTQIAKTSSPTYTDTAATVGYTYYYRARAYFQSGNTVNYGAFSNVAPVSDYAYLEVTNGILYESIAARAAGTEFTLLNKQHSCGKETVLPYAPSELPSGEYIYGVYGEHITYGAKVTTDEQGHSIITLPYANADAIIFAKAPIITYGDTNSDGKISLIDAIRVIRTAVGEKVSNMDVAAGDMDGDIKVTAMDALKLIMFILNQ